MAEQPNFLLITYSAQGHLNPTLQFAKRLLRLGARVTLAITIFAHRRITAAPPEGLTFAVYSDGYDNGFKMGRDDPESYGSETRRRGRDFLTDLMKTQNDDGGQVFDCLVYTMLLQWAAEVADEYRIPSTLLWIQPASVFSIYYYYFNGGGGDQFLKNDVNDPSFSLNLPGLPSLSLSDLPSFLNPSNAYPFAVKSFVGQFDRLSLETNKKLLVNTFDALELEALDSVSGFDLVGIGPLLPSAFLDGDDPSDTAFGGDLFEGSNDYLKWLDSRPKSSVVYVSFGSIVELKETQFEELAKALIESGHEFLWVIRKKQGEDDESGGKACIYKKELERRGMVVSWCSQLEVLSHPAVGCFVTHCGWNSTLESLSMGKPVVAFPQWTDQGTNAKLLEDVWRTGVRVRENGDGLVESDEIKRCLEAVMGGPTTEEMRGMARKWMALAREAVAPDGSSHVNLKAFVQEIGKVKNLPASAHVRRPSRAVSRPLLPVVLYLPT